MQNQESLEYLRTYVNRGGNIMHVYLVHCSKKLKELMKANNPYYREENGKPLYFTTRDLSDSPCCQIINGRVRFVNIDLQEGF